MEPQSPLLQMPLVDLVELVGLHRSAVRASPPSTVLQVAMARARPPLVPLPLPARRQLTILREARLVAVAEPAVETVVVRVPVEKVAIHRLHLAVLEALPLAMVILVAMLVPLSLVAVAVAVVPATVRMVPAALVVYTEPVAVAVAVTTQHILAELALLATRLSSG